jgi:hypothetical protein
MYYLFGGLSDYNATLIIERIEALDGVACQLYSFSDKDLERFLR